MLRRPPVTKKPLLVAAWAATALALAGPATAQTPPASASPATASSPVTAWLGQTYKPRSGEKLSFYVWGATAIEVSEYRIADAGLEAALRDGSIAIDTGRLSPTRRETFRSEQGQVTVADASGVYVYIARATAGNTSNNTNAQAVIVSRIGLAVKRDDVRSLAFVHASRGTDLVPNATIKVLRANGAAAPSPVATATTGPRGVATIATSPSGNLLYIARSGADVAIQQTWDRSAGGPQPTLVAHVETDRPLYRPGHVMRYRAILRDTIAPSRTYRTPVGQDVRVFARDPKGTRLSLGTLATSAFGTVSGELAIPATAPLGDWALEIEAGPVGPNTYPIATASFGVQEYRKPEFKVAVTTASTSYVQGATVDATVRADYYFGAPVPDAKVHYTVTRQPRWRWWNPWLDGVAVRMMCMPPIFFQPPTVVAQGDVRTARDGTARISFPTTRGDQDADYSIEAKVQDASNREVAGSASVAVTRAAMDLVLVTDRYVYQPGDQVKLRVNLAAIADTLRSPGGSPVAGSLVRVKVEALDPQGRRTPRVDRTLLTDVSGTASLTLLARTTNQYVITASASDAARNQISAERTIWVQDSRGGVDWSFSNVEILADKDVYAPGETAFLLVKAPVRNGSGLLTLESKGVKSAQVFPIRFGLGLVAVPVTTEMTPNIFATVLVPTANGLVSAEKELAVPPQDSVIDVTIAADKPEYRPGEQATFKLRAVDSRGRPVRAEIALAIVDEALYALREDGTRKLSDTFFPKLWDDVTTVGANGGGGPRILRMAMGAATGTAAVPDAAKAKGARVREYFPDTMRWVARIVTDANGEATLSQKIADSLTTWRLTAFAITADTRIGETRTTTLVRKDLIVRLETPRTLVEGDELTLVGIVHNLAKPGTAGAAPATVRVRLDVQGVTLLDPADRTVTVGREDLARVTWKARVDTAAQAVLQANAQASFDQDALRTALPIAARGVAARDVAAGSLLADGQVALSLKKDARAIDAASELRITLSPSLAATMLESLDYLTGYPYGCVEQTMSRFLPDVIVADVLKTLGRDDSALAAQLPAMVQDGVERLRGMQGPDGGWGWWAGNESNPFMSAYATYGLALAKRGGFKVPDDMLDRATGFLERSLSTTDLDGRAYQLFALTTAGKSRASDLLDLSRRRALLNDYSKATLAIALKQAGQAGAAADVLADLNRSAIVSSGRCHWEGKTLHYGAWQSNTIETTAYALRAFLELDPQSSKVADTVAWLAERRQDSGQYTTTKDTAAVVSALARYVTITHELDPALDATVTVNGRAAGSVQFTRDDLAKRGKTIKVPASALAAGPNAVVVARTGRGALYYSAVLDQKVRMNPILAEDAGIRVERSFTVVTSRLDPATSRLVETETPLAGDVKLGDTVRVKIKVSVSRTADVENVNIEDRFAAGFSVVEETPTWWNGWTGWWSAREVHDDRIVFFATALPLMAPGGGSQFEYRYDLRAEVAGKFTALPTQAEAVYAPETHGRSDAKAFTIVAN